MSAEAQANALLALLNASLSPRSAYDIDDLPEALPADYVELHVSRRFGGNQRLSAGVTPTGWRVTTRSVGDTVSNTRALTRLVTAALEDATVEVGGVRSTPIQFETEDPIAADDGTYSGLTSWTYTL